MRREKRIRLERVDIQVSIMTSLIVIVSFLLVYFFNYCITYQSMLHTLSERSNRIHSYVENKIDPSTFHTLSKEEDMQTETYLEVQEDLSNIREATGVRYLYTAKMTEEGDYIYLIDGLPSDSEDFRKPGDLIEVEIIPELQEALGNKIVLPDDIKETTWGEIFVAYFPIHENGEVVGVLGMEFPADQEYAAFRKIRIGTPIIAFGSVIIAVLLALRYFKRISNPTYQDLYNTDFLTGLKNRNAFEIDLKNLNERGTFNGIGMIVADLNDLKGINDRFGHQMGDWYIKDAAQIISACASKQFPVYRVGGDEFNVILSNVDESDIQRLIAKIKKYIETYEKDNPEMPMKISIGYALFDPKLDQNLTDTYHRGDSAMYEVKRKMKCEE